MDWRAGRGDEAVYLNARYYDPEIGRFVSPNPYADLGQGLNRFSYSFNNPIDFADPVDSGRLLASRGIPMVEDCHGRGFVEIWESVRSVFGYCRSISNEMVYQPTSKSVR